jgi:hypothetical protein
VIVAIVQQSMKVIVAVRGTSTPDGSFSDPGMQALRF